MNTITKSSKIDILERGRDNDGNEQSTNRRLYVQLHVYSGCKDPGSIIRILEPSGLEAVLYLDLNHPQGIGLLTMFEDPSDFITIARPLLSKSPFSSFVLRPEFTMLGRTYASGYEPNVEDWLLNRPRHTIMNSQWPWAVWYPLRRTGTFNALPDNVQQSILREHGGIGRLYGQQDLAHDIRLACHGIDTNDNEFVIGLVGKNLYPLSHLVQRMRKTRQTSEFMQQMGPFFVGRSLWQSHSS